MSLNLNVIAGQNARLIRKRMKIRQIKMAKFLQVTQGYYSLLENGERAWDLDLLQKISKQLKVKPERLLQR